MARRQVHDLPTEDNNAADLVDAFATRKSKRSSNRMGPARFAKELEDVQRRVRQKDWSGITPLTLVAVYAWCFREIHGFVPTELSAKRSPHIKTAAMHAGRLVKNTFEGDTSAALDFVRWAVETEASREEWARKNKKERQPLGWKSLFIATWMMDSYRASQMRAKDRAR